MTILVLYCWAICWNFIANLSRNLAYGLTEDFYGLMVEYGIGMNNVAVYIGIRKISISCFGQYSILWIHTVFNLTHNIVDFERTQVTFIINCLTRNQTQNLNLMKQLQNQFIETMLTKRCLRLQLNVLLMLMPLYCSPSIINFHKCCWSHEI